MPLSLSLTNQGSIPKNPTLKPNSTLAGVIKLPNTTPNVGSGLNNGNSSIMTSQAPKPLGLGANTAPQLGKNPGMLPPQANTSLKKTTTNNVDGSSTVHEFHAPLAPDDPSFAYNRETGVKNPKYIDPNAPKVTPPPPLTVGGQAPGVLQTGQQTDNEKATQNGLIQSGQPTELEKYYLDQTVKARGMQNAGALGQYADAGNNANASPQELYNNLINAPDLAAKGTANKGLYDTFSNIYGSAATQGLLGANTIAGRGTTAAQGAYTGAQNQAGRAAGQASDVLGAVAPQFPSYGSQTVQPGLLGQGNTNDTSLQSAVSNVVQKLTNGTMSYNDAVSALSGYGQGGLNALQQALPPNFNVAQSNTLAGQQGSIGVNYQLADNALTNVEKLMNELPSIQNTNVPAVNSLTQGFSTLTGLGSEQTRAVTGAVQTLRNAYASLLASSRGGTPTDYSGQAQAEIPDKPTANDIAAIRKNFETLGKTRADILGNPGQASSTSSGSTGGSMFGSFFGN